MTSVVWTTALGLPIVQPYRKAARKQVQTAIQSVFISDPRAPSEGDNFFDWIMALANFFLTSSQFGQTSFCFPTQFHSQSRCYAHVVDRSGMQGMFMSSFMIVINTDFLSTLTESRIDFRFYPRFLLDTCLWCWYHVGRHSWYFHCSALF